MRRKKANFLGASAARQAAKSFGASTRHLEYWLEITKVAVGIIGGFSRPHESFN